MELFNTKNTFNRFLLTSAFVVICVAVGFMLATGWETPSKVSAQSPDTQFNKYTVPLIDEEGNSPFVNVAETVKPVVVNITAEKILEGNPSLPFDIFDWGPFFGEPPGGKKRQPHVTSGGSGIIIDREGHIITNYHVIAEAEEITVKLADGSKHTAEVIGSDPETDVALIKINNDINEYMVAKLGDSDKIRIGEWAIAVGNPFGLDWTVTVGVISARGRSNLRIGGDVGPSYQDFIQTDASINFGNSGGPLVNIHGEVIGVNTAINAQAQGIGFAIPINMASKVIEQLLISGTVHRGYLGIIPAELDEIKREALDIDNDVTGIFVEGVQEDTPADKGKLKAGDIISAIENKPVLDVKNFRFLIADYPPDTKVEMTVLRKGKSRKMKFLLGERSDFINRPMEQRIKREQFWLGIQVASTDSREGKLLGVDGMRGVVVIGIAPDSPAEGLLEPSDVIVEIGGIEIENTDDFLRAAKELEERKKAIPFWVNRNGRRIFIPIRPE
ncbi:MAG: trypsin-like peptidase domain-containing protein [Candidatus Hatepunaea meridiana]|nr:trypsin-like peptidase domain-containing protein [Candidatus Hatepunaea meridiana]